MAKSSVAVTKLRNRMSEAERETRIDLAAAFRVAHHLGWNNTINNHIAARVPGGMLAGSELLVLVPGQGLSDGDMAELAGLAENEVELTVDDGVLTISGEKQSEKEEEGRHFHRVERSFGRGRDDRPCVAPAACLFQCVHLLDLGAPGELVGSAWAIGALVSSIPPGKATLSMRPGDRQPREDGRISVGATALRLAAGTRMNLGRVAEKTPVHVFGTGGVVRPN